ncbi:flagellar biosynthesis anti-sigma factor FlgM [Gallaecimonas kandeliae]|uniref:flagellar biosynthesis anti-sigma factor FlgM n=1 Tax=Gallaecimonas kandeliae TaxID=3029055 RepID=UPI00264A0518|nr:flagellar biosynthesis anti-sigma factor FlgM [Gallaecimonas kandeliae]WKE66703.1 flagellar biosynthesis anti-sigma factor FlgM [Gallaecimonas kandeliae]
MAINKVNQGQTQDLTPARLNQAKQAGEQAKTQSAAPQTSAKLAQDAVSITPQAAGLDKMQRNMSSQAPFDKEKVESLKKAISSGQYKVDHQKLADKLLQFEDDLFGN